MPNDGFYQRHRWWKLRAKVKSKWIREGKLCAFCNKEIDWTKRPIADHIQPRSQRPDLEYDERNIQYLHHECHSTKTNRVERLQLPEIGADGMPVGSEWS